MSSVALVAVASNYLFWGVLNCRPAPAISCASPSYGTSLCPSSFLVQLCTPFLLTTCGSPRGTASEAGAHPCLDWVFAQLCYRFPSFLFFLRGFRV